jgi:hypothetical protein
MVGDTFAAFALAGAGLVGAVASGNICFDFTFYRIHLF